MKNITVETGSPLFAQLHDSLYQDMHEKYRHFHTIKTLAEECDRPIHDVAELYEDLLESLKERAEILDYLPVLVAKRVKEIYRRRS